MTARRRRAPRLDIDDAALACFVKWCRYNPADVVDAPGVARAVLTAYASTSPPPPAPVDDAPTVEPAP